MLIVNSSENNARDFLETLESQSRIDLNHVCRALIEHTGMYVHCQADQTRFPPQGDVSRAI